jgi:hypothetical protein
LEGGADACSIEVKLGGADACSITSSTTNSGLAALSPTSPEPLSEGSLEGENKNGHFDERFESLLATEAKKRRASR